MAYVRIDLSISSTTTIISKSRLINSFVANGKRMKSAYISSDLFTGDNALKTMRLELAEIAKKKSRPIAAKLEGVLNTIKKNKKRIDPSTWRQYEELAGQLLRL